MLNGLDIMPKWDDIRTWFVYNELGEIDGGT